jgi:peptidyl-prolyl cis-trans isomerase C
MKKFFVAVIPAICMGLACAAFAGDGGEVRASAAVQQSQPDSGASRADSSRNQNEKEKKTIVARVNGVDINLQSLINMMISEKARLGRISPTPEEKEALVREAMDRLIFEELAYQKATAEGMKADPAEIDKRIADLRVQYGGPDVLEERMKENGVTEADLRSAIARNMVLQRIFKKEIDDKVAPPPEAEIKKAYEKDKSNMVVAEKVLVNDITFFLDLDKSESVAQAGKVLDRLRADKNIDPKSLTPDGSFIVREEELNRVKQPKLYEEAKKLKVGQYSGVIQTSDSLHIIQLKEYDPARAYTFEEMRGFLAGQIRNKAVEKRTREWEDELRKGAKIEILDTRNHEQKPAKDAK